MANLGAADTQIREAAAASRATWEADTQESNPEDAPPGEVRTSSGAAAETVLAPPAAPRPFSPPPAWVRGGLRTPASKRYNLLNVRAPGAGTQLSSPPSQGVPSPKAASGEDQQDQQGKSEGPSQSEPEKMISLPAPDVPKLSMKRGAEQGAEESPSGKKARVESSSLPAPESSGTVREAELTRQAAALKPEGLAPHLETVLAAFNADYTPNLWEETARAPIMIGVEELAALGAQVAFLGPSTLVFFLSFGFFRWSLL